MTRLIIAIGICCLVGCTSPPVIIESTKYTVRETPEELKIKPIREPSADVNITTDNEAALFLVNTEAYISALEKAFDRLIKFHDRPIE